MAGTIIPPSAAMAGAARRLGEASCPLRHLAPQLKADQEEKDGHQPVVDPEMRVERTQLREQQAMVDRAPGRVGPDQRGHGGEDEQRAAGALRLHEAKQSAPGSRSACRRVGSGSYLSLSVSRGTCRGAERQRRHGGRRWRNLCNKLICLNLDAPMIPGAKIPTRQ